MALAVFSTACSQGRDPDVALQAQSADEEQAAADIVPNWVGAGFARASELRLADPLRRPTTAETQTPDNGLPSLPEFKELMAKIGLDDDSIECIYVNFSEGPAAKLLSQLLILLENTTEEEGYASVGEALNDFTPGELQQFLVALAPCVDPDLFVSILLALFGAEPGQVTAASALGSFADDTLGGISGSELLGLLISIAGVPLGAGAGAFAAAAAAGGFTGAETNLVLAAILGVLGEVDTLAEDIDFSDLDVSEYGAEEFAALLFLAVRGLNDRQQANLIGIANYRLSAFELQLDASDLEADQGGALLVLLLPFLSAAITPPDTNTPPPGQDLQQVYIPAGADLSQINPLFFVPRDDLVNSFAEQGVPEETGGCIYERVRELDWRIVGLALSGGDGTGTAQMLTALIGCVLTT